MSNNNQWFYAVNNKQQGPVCVEELFIQFQNGVLTNNTLVWQAGMTDWLSLGEVEALKTAFNELKNKKNQTKSDEWFYAIGNERKGPVLLQEIINKIKNKTINKTDLIWNANFIDWKEIQQVEELLPYFNQTNAQTNNNNKEEEALFKYANIKYIFSSKLKELSELVLPEKWGFKSNNNDLDILNNYILVSFERAMEENKIINTNKLSIFNTGLFDKTYEQVYMIFKKNDHKEKYPQEWRFLCWCNNNELQTKYKFTQEPPLAPQYWKDISELVFDYTKSIIEPNWDHILKDNISRIPREFIVSQCIGYDTNEYNDEQLKKFVIEKPDIFINLREMLKSKINLTIKRVRGNYKLAVPIYYRTEKQISLLLPLYLTNDKQADLALVVRRDKNGNYEQKTIYKIEWAIKFARIICRQYDDWLKM